MGLRDLDIVDLVAIDESTGYVVLIIEDDEEWFFQGEHLILLEEKINTYLRYIEDGELFELYPQAKERGIVIKIIGKYPFTRLGEVFIEKVNKILEKAGYGFQYISNPDTGTNEIDDKKNRKL